MENNDSKYQRARIKFRRRRKKIENNESETVVLQRRALRAKRNLKSGEIIQEDNIISLRPCPKEGLLPFEKEKILNKKLKKNIIKGDLIKWEDLV